MQEEYSFIIPGKPKPKERPRMTKRGRTYTPQRTLQEEERIREEYDGPVFTGPVEVYITLTADHTEVMIAPVEWSSPLRGDIDNYLKLVLDALQPVAFDNDRQVHRVVVDKS